MTTDPESEQESLYESLFKVMRSDENESELINRMKEESSVIISDLKTRSTTPPTPRSGTVGDWQLAHGTL